MARKQTIPAVILALCGVSSAQSLPDAGSIRQQLEPMRPLALPVPSQAPAPAPGRVQGPTAAAGLRVAVHAFRLSGNTLLSDAALQAVLQPWSGQTLDFAELQRAANAVAAAYRQAGWIVRVLLPEQDISSGLVTLQIVEARLGSVRLEGPAPTRVLASELEAHVLAQQAPGQPIGAAALDRALLLMDDLPGLNVTGTLVPGARDGESDLVLRTSDQPWVLGEITLDNAGTRATGSQRVLANVNINSPGLRGELLSLSLLRSAGSDYARLGLTVPDGHNGLRLGINRSFMSYRVVEGPSHNSAAPIRGHSGSTGLEMSYPLLRSRSQNLYASGALENKTFFTQDSAVRSDYATNSLRLGLAGNAQDTLGLGGSSSASVQLLWGQLTDMQAHHLINTLERHYRKVNYSLSRQQTLSAAHALSVSFSGQWAGQVLDSSEKMYLGGAQSVRAYPASELSGDRGQLLNLEWRWRIAPTLMLSAFADHGRAQSLPAQPADAHMSLSLRGHGLGAAWRGPGGIETRLVWSRRQGTNPRPTSTGTDSDGTLTLNRLWLSATLGF